MNILYKIILFIILVFSLHNYSYADKISHLKLVLDWTPNTNHTGIIVAQAKGFYKKYGIDLEVMGSGQTSAEILVAKGIADFGISFSKNIIKANEKNIPIISIAAIMQHDTSGIYSFKSKNITRPKDFEHKIYGVEYGEIGEVTKKLESPTIRYIMLKDGGDPSTVKTMFIGNIDFWKVKSIDFADGYQGWEGIEAKINHIAFNFIPILKYRGCDQYSPIIITNKDMIKKHSDLIQKFINATKEGYDYAIKYPDESAKILLKQYPDLNSKLIVESQKFLSPEYAKDAPYWGYQNKKIWDKYIEWLYSNKIITKKIKSQDVFTNQFLAKANS